MDIIGTYTVAEKRIFAPAKQSGYDYVCSEVSKGIANVALASDIPVLFGVLTTDTIEQAIERAGTKAGNKGAECAQGAIEMVNLIRTLESEEQLH